MVASFKVVKNGTADIESSIVKSKLETGNDVKCISLLFTTSISSSDYLEVWAANTTNTKSIIVSHMSFFSTGLPYTPSA